MNKDSERSDGFTININMEGKIIGQDFLKLFTITTVAAIGASCNADKVFVPTSEGDTGGNGARSSETSPTETTEIQKITTGELSLITDKSKREEIISTLPSNRPKDDGNTDSYDIFDIQVGDKKFTTVMYPLSSEEIANQVVIETTDPTGKKIDSIQNVAAYTQYVDVDNNVSWVRLIATNPNDNTVWMYDPSGFPTQSGQTVDMQRAVLGYKFDANTNSAKILFQPLFVNPNYITGYDYTDAVDVIAQADNVPEKMKVQAIVAKPEAPLPAELSAFAEKIKGTHKIELNKDKANTYVLIDLQKNEPVKDVEFDVTDPTHVTWSLIYQFEGETIKIPQELSTIAVDDTGKITNMPFPGYVYNKETGAQERKMFEGEPVLNVPEAQWTIIRDGKISTDGRGFSAEVFQEFLIPGFGNPQLRYNNLTEYIYNDFWYWHQIYIPNGDGSFNVIETTQYKINSAVNEPISFVTFNTKNGLTVIAVDTKDLYDYKNHITEWSLWFEKNNGWWNE